MEVGGRQDELASLALLVSLLVVVDEGAASRDFYGQSGDGFEGFKLGEPNVLLDDTLLLIEPTAAAAYEAAQKQREPVPADPGEADGQRAAGGGDAGAAAAGEGGTAGAPAGGRGGLQPAGGSPPGTQPAKPRMFFGSVGVSATTAKMNLVAIAEEVIAVLAADPNATVKVTVEITAEFSAGASDQTRRAVSENATALGFKSKSWE